MQQVRNIGLWPVRRSQIFSAVTVQRVTNPLGTQITNLCSYRVCGRQPVTDVSGELRRQRSPHSPQIIE